MAKSARNPWVLPAKIRDFLYHKTARTKGVAEFAE
jgi:hypothetical protein